jgi:hypothetical protein
MRKELFHHDFREIDLPKLESMLDKRQFYEFLQCLQKEMRFIQRDPINNGSSPCQFPPLLDYRKKKFFSVSRPPEDQSPDMRLIYRFDKDNNTIYYLAVGKRISMIPSDPEDIYQQTKKRDLP